MKKFIIALALSAVVASAPNVIAAAGGIQNWMQKWQAQQSEQQQIDKSLDKIDSDAARWGTAAGSGAQTMSQQPASPTRGSRSEY